MKHACNISSRGARQRLFSGVSSLAAAALIVILMLATGVLDDWHPWPMVAAIALGAFGLLGVYQGLNQWCVAVALMERLGLGARSSKGSGDAAGKH